MKKILITIGIIGMFFLTTIPTVTSVKITDEKKAQYMDINDGDGPLQAILTATKTDDRVWDIFVSVKNKLNEEITVNFASNKEIYFGIWTGSLEIPLMDELVYFKESIYHEKTITFSPNEKKLILQNTFRGIGNTGKHKSETLDAGSYEIRGCTGWYWYETSPGQEDLFISEEDSVSIEIPRGFAKKLTLRLAILSPILLKLFKL